MQSFFIGIGATLANALPYLFRQLGVTRKYSPAASRLTVQYSFKIGAVVFLLAVLWTVFTTKEYPPENMEEFERKRRETYGNATGIAKIFKVIAELLREISSAFAQYAEDDEAARGRSVLHLARTVLHVDVLWFDDLLPRFRRDERTDPLFALRAGVGRQCLRDLLDRLFRRCLSACRQLAASYQPQNSARHFADLRRARACFGLLHP